MRQQWLQILGSQLLNFITVCLFYMTSNPIRNVILNEGYPILFCTLVLYLCAPLTLVYLLVYWIIACTISVYTGICNVYEVVSASFGRWRRRTMSYCDCYRNNTSDEAAGIVEGEEVEKEDEVSAPPSYYSTIPPYNPADADRQRGRTHGEGRQGRGDVRQVTPGSHHDMAHDVIPPTPISSITVLRGALSDIRHCGTRSNRWRELQTAEEEGRGGRTVEEEGRGGQTVHVIEGIQSGPPPPYPAPPAYTR